MSVELHAFVPRDQIPDRGAWEGAITALGIPFQFHPEFRPAEARGFCPITSGVLTSGCEIECGLETVGSLGEVYESLRVLDPEVVVMSFRWSGSPEEGACAMAAAAGLVSGFGASVFNPQGDAFTDLQSLVRDMKAMSQFAASLRA